jgi:hypothetical protein
MTGLLIWLDAHIHCAGAVRTMGEEMVHRTPKRYTVARSGDGYEVQDGDAARARVYFSDSRRAARKISKQLNRAQGNAEQPPDPWAGGNFGGTGGG